MRCHADGVVHHRPIDSTVKVDRKRKLQFRPKPKLHWKWLATFGRKPKLKVHAERLPWTINYVCRLYCRLLVLRSLYRSPYDVSIGVRRISQWGGGLNIRPAALPTWLLMNKQYCVNDISPVLLSYRWTTRQQRETKIIIIIYHYLGYENYWAIIFWLVQWGGGFEPPNRPSAYAPGHVDRWPSGHCLMPWLIAAKRQDFVTFKTFGFT